MSITKWQNALAVSGLAEDTLSSTIKKRIINFRKLQEEIGKAQEELPSVVGEKKIAEFNNWILAATEKLNAEDDSLAIAIPKFAKNKDVYAANAEHLRRGREKKMSGANPAPAPAPPPPPAPAPAPPAAPAPADDKKEKGGVVKKNAWGWVAWALGGVAIIIGAAVGIKVYDDNQ